MEKPKPQELVIEDISNEKVSRLLRLTWASPAAKAWAEANAKEFGNALIWALLRIWERLSGFSWLQRTTQAKY